jgi:conjugal transfer pilus assembly protein TraL
MQTIRIPGYVDELMQFGPYEIDEWGITIVGVLGGIVSGSMFYGIVGGVGIAWTFSRFKSGKPRGMLLHVLYWYGIVPMKGLWCERAFAKDWVK